MKQTKGKKIRNIALSCVALALVAAISVAITLASVTANLGSETNTITSADNLTLAIQEDKWDGLDYGGTSTATTTTLGETLAKSYSSGMEIPKNPSLKNTSTESLDSDGVDKNSEWVAMVVTYKVKINDNETTYSSYSAFAKALAQVYSNVASTNFNTAASGTSDTEYWEAKDANNTVFYYNTKLASGEETETLFDQVTINSTFTTTSTTADGSDTFYYVITDGDGAEQTTSTLPTFTITLTGYAVQGYNVAYSDAKTALDALMSK